MRTLLLLATSLALVFPLCAQDEEVKENLKKFTDTQKSRRPIAADQIFYAEWFAENWEKVGARERLKVHKLVAYSLRSRDKNVRDKSIDALVKMVGGKRERFSGSAFKILHNETRKKTTEKDLAYFGSVVRAMGKTKYERGISQLKSFLKHKDDAVIAASAGALGNYSEANLAVRKDVVGELLKAYTSASNQARDPRNVVAKNRLAAIQGDMEASLKQLTGQSLQGADAWWKWWQNTGKKSRQW